MIPTVPPSEALTAVKVKVSPSTSVSFVITFVLVNKASSATVKASATATGDSLMSLIKKVTVVGSLVLPAASLAVTVKL